MKEAELAQSTFVDPEPAIVFSPTRLDIPQMSFNNKQIRYHHVQRK